MVKSALSWLAAAATMLPAAAWACPTCASKADGGVAQYLALGLFVTFPFAIAAVVIRVVKRGEATRGPADDTGTVHPARRQTP